MKKLTVVSALMLSLVLAACGGGGGDDGAPAASNGGANVQNNGAGSKGSDGGGSSGNASNGSDGSNGSAAAAGGGGTASSGSGASESSAAGSGNSGGGAATSGGADSSGAGTGGSASNGSNSNGGNSNGSNTNGSGSNGSGSNGANAGSGGASGSGTSGGSSAGTGGSGSSGSGSSGSTNSGNGANTGGGASADLGNTVPVLVSPASSVVNFPLVSVTICQPNSGAQAKCSTIDNVLLDTGSFGLRLYASAIPPATLAALPIQTDAASGKNLAVCASFASGHIWGSLRTADVKLSREVAAAVPIHVMTDPAVVSDKPQSCAYNVPLSSPSVLGANGILGIGTAQYDCGTSCAAAAIEGAYYVDAKPATPVAVPLVKQVTNPVSLFPVDNNGVIVEMPAISSSGARTASGTLTFGVGTQANNSLSSASTTLLATDRWGDFQGSYNGGASVLAFIDSGSNSTNFDDRTITQWAGFYAPPGEWTRDITISDLANASAKVTVRFANAVSLINSGNHAFSNLAGYIGQMVDLGLPFFYGRRVYYGIEGAQSAGGRTGPYVAYTSN
ncbi:DUF3443 family protein [Paraburkholderia sp. J41]|uniref:DUF3443 family protein n=1 Tax=Paraburkholderia sp. J41 TaxID=2805433 RepID=UPI002AC34212|nr:DUF3443 family protein [Paraburkholderia sp. J41]